jgi:hypothetical protein
LSSTTTSVAYQTSKANISYLFVGGLLVFFRTILNGNVRVLSTVDVHTDLRDLPRFDFGGTSCSCDLLMGEP